MKKFLAIALIAATFVACNEGEKKVEDAVHTADSAASAVVDSAAPTVNAVPDSAAATVNAVVDPAKAAVTDSSKK